MNTEKTAVHFGAGNIGRGFLAQLYTESGLKVLFVDVLDHIIEALHSRGCYPLDIVETDRTTRIQIRPVDAIHAGNMEAVADALAGADIASTAVGANVLTRLAGSIARGIERRRIVRPDTPLNFILCENLHDAADLLKPLVHAHLDESAKAWAETHIGFVNASIGRMVPIMTDEQKAEDPLLVRVEPYCELPVDADALISPYPEIKHMKPIARFISYVERKLYVHNLSHAATAYLGWFHQHRYIWQAAEDPVVVRIARAAAMESCQALFRKYGMPLPELEAHVNDLFQRYRNRALGDTVERVARDPIRKLGPEDRIIGAARMCLEAGITPENIAMVAVAASLYRNPDDPAACQIQNIMQEKGPHAVFTEISGVQPSEPLYPLLQCAHEALTTTFPAASAAGF